MLRKRILAIVVSALCLTVALLTVLPTRSNPGATTPANSMDTPSSYDSGWLNITDKCGQNITITHNLNSTNLIVDIQGKTTPDGGPMQRNYGLTGLTSGWSQPYGGTGDDEAYALVQTNDGGYALAGYTNSFGAGSYDFWLVKTDSNGNMQWNKTYGGTGDDEAYALIQTSDRGYAIAGYTNSFGAGSYDFWLVKTDPSGNMQWNKTYGGTGDDEAYALVQTNDGGYAIAGYTYSYGAGGDFWLVKTDASGTMQWNKTYGGTSGDFAHALVKTADGGYAIAGMTYPDTTPSYFWLVKTDSNGNMQWNKTYAKWATNTINALVQTSDGGYALAGETSSVAFSDEDFWFVKTDTAGNVQWNKTYGAIRTPYSGYNYEWADALVQTTDGGYALAGYTASFGAGGSDFWLVKTGVESGLAWIDSFANTITLYRGATDAYWNFVRVTITVRSSASLFLVVRGEDNGIYYRLFNESSGTWNAWEKLPGATLDSPAATIVGNQLQVVVRGMDGSSLWYGTIDLTTDTFSGWTQLSGATPSAPELASTGTTPP